jgi:SprT protein
MPSRNNNHDVLQFIPESAHSYVSSLLKVDHLIIKVKNERKTRHGDYKELPDGFHMITVNNNLNPYRFLITLIHEIAHFEAYKNYGKRIKPHGIEWKLTFKHLMLPLINPQVFPDEFLPLLARHFKNPKASSDTDVALAKALRSCDMDDDKTYVYELEHGTKFKIYNGREFKRGKKRTKRIECLEIKSGRLYLFNPNAEVEVIE